MSETEWMDFYNNKKSKKISSIKEELVLMGGCFVVLILLSIIEVYHV